MLLRMLLFHWTNEFNSVHYSRCGTFISDEDLIKAEAHFQANKVAPSEVGTKAVLNVSFA